MQFAAVGKSDVVSSALPVVTADTIIAASQTCRDVYVHPVLEDYLLDIIEATRTAEAVRLGGSPRATLALYRTSQALAAINGRSYILPDDIQRLVEPVLAHRLILNTDARLRGYAAPQLLVELLEKIPVPVEEVWND